MRNLDLIRASFDLLSGKWLMVILASILIMICQSFFQFIDPKLAVMNLVLAGPFSLGAAKYFLKIVRGEQENIEDIFSGFSRFVPALLATIIMAIVVILGFILLIIPGVILSLGLSQVYYVMLDEPGLSATDALKKSWELMDGYKVKYFLLGLLFAGIVILGILALFVGVFVAIPLIYTTSAMFYDKLRKGALMKV